MRPPSLAIYLSADERRYLRRVALDLGLSASQLVRLAGLLTARQAEERLRQGLPPERIIEALREQQAKEARPP